MNFRFPVTLTLTSTLAFCPILSLAKTALSDAEQKAASVLATAEKTLDKTPIEKDKENPEKARLQDSCI